MKVCPEGRIGYLCSGHAQDVPVRYSTVPDSSNVLNTGTQPFLCRRSTWNSESAYPVIPEFAQQISGIAGMAASYRTITELNDY